MPLAGGGDEAEGGPRAGGGEGAEGGPATDGGHDLRLAAPAAGAWLAALLLLGTDAAVAYATAAVAVLGAVLLATRSARDQSPHVASLLARTRLARVRSIGGGSIVGRSVRDLSADDPGVRGLSVNDLGVRDLSPNDLEAGERSANDLGAGGLSAGDRRSGAGAIEDRGVAGRRVLEWSAADGPADECPAADRSAAGAPTATGCATVGPPAAGWPAGGRVVSRRVMVGVLACVAASAAGVGFRLTAVGSGPVRALAVREATVTLGAVVTGDPVVSVKAGSARRRTTVLVPVRVEEVERRRVRVPVLLLASDEAWKPLVPSQHVRLAARLVVPRSGELLAAVGLVRGPPTVVGGPSLPQRWASVIRSRLRAAVGRLPADQRGVLPGLVDGDTSLLDPELTDAFEKAGLTHLMAVSGENLSLLIGAVLLVGRLTGLGRRTLPLLAGATVFGFVLVARPSPSVLRAAVMGSVALLAVVTGRERRGVPALCAAVIALVLLDPGLARSYGFALSALATAGILVFGPPWRRCLARRLPGSVPGRVPRRVAAMVAEPLAVSAAAHVACAPVLVLLDGEVSLVAVPANLLAAPAVGPATLLGVLAAAVAPMSLSIARVIVVPAGLAVGWIAGVARVCARAPYAAVAWPAGPVGAALLAVVFIVGALTLRRPGVRRVAAAAMAGVAVVALIVHVWAPGWPPRGWQFVACDVGQGDGLVLAAGPGRAVVVDTGPDPRPIDRCLSDLRIRAVPLLVLTHPHADHVDGVRGVLRGRVVGETVISPDSEGEERRLLVGRRVRPAGIGDVWTVGPLTLGVIGPLTTLRVSTRDPGTQVNDASVVLLARWPGLSALLCGDVETEAQRRLLAAGTPHADILKVPHHGSSHQDPDFLAATHARIAVTSVGVDNDYGHPAPATMALLARLGLRSYRTDRDGDIAVIGSRDGPTVVTRRPRSG
ncbi:ComEC/Rec2 family competence protein [Actinoallomurus vinaceus]|uniref:ComEC/Rec2 family competence protein n=1 Tax=Actinoallomurus vinaceus TaxID=1080074 RepID=UPI0031EE9951